MNRLETSAGGIKLINPFILASGPPARTGEMIAKAFGFGWAGAVTKTVCLNYEQMCDISPRFIKTAGGLQNLELISPVSPEIWANDITNLKTDFPKNVIIASVSAGIQNLEDWQKLALMMQDSGADAIELNFSCPHGLPELGMGNTCSDSPDLAGLIVKNIKSTVKIPVWVKISPNISSTKILAEKCVNNGADGITAVNTLKGFAGVDIKTGIPLLNVEGNSAYGGISGSPLKPLSLKIVSEIAASLDCPVSASGGIRTWQDSIEFIMLGASSLQLCTEVMFRGYELVTELIEGTNNYLKENRLGSVNEIKGISLKYIKEYSELNKNTESLPEINFDNCTKCGKCIKSCNDSGYQAIVPSGQGFPVIDKDKCTGCGLCRIICPTQCIKITPKEVFCSQIQKQK